METAKRQPTIVLDVSSAELVVGERRVRLTPRLLAVLRHFAENPRRLISKQELLDRVWPQTHVTEGLVKDYVRRARRLLGDDAGRPRFIETARGHGYRLIGDIELFQPERGPAGGATQRAMPAIAVLPFADRSGARDKAYFAAGVAEDIMTSLARFRSLVVIARDSSFLEGAEPADLKALADGMGVDFVIRGTLRHWDGKIRLAVQLIEVAGMHCIWAENFDRRLDDIFAVQDEIAQAVAVRVVGHVEDSGRRQALRKQPEGLAVYDCLLLGNWHVRQAGETDVERAREMFSRAIEIEPSNARAHAELAFSYLTEFWSDWTTAPGAAARQALALAREAVALDEFDARAHLYLATAHFYAASNFEAAAAAFDRAMELNPNDYDALCLRSWLLALAGEPDASIACAERAIGLSPLTTEDCRLAQCCAAYCAQRYDEALAALEAIPDPGLHVKAFFAMCHAQKGDDAKAQAAMADFLAAATRKVADQTASRRGGWRDFWGTRYPFRRHDDLEHMLEGLAKAGMAID